MRLLSFGTPRPCADLSKALWGTSRQLKSCFVKTLHEPLATDEGIMHLACISKCCIAQGVWMM